MDQIDFHGNKIESLPDGSVRITRQDGSTFVIGNDGAVKIDLTGIKSVSVGNIFELRSYVIMREGELTAHSIEFLNGGKVRVAFTTDGKLVEFSGQNVQQSITKDNEIVLRSSDAESGA